MSAIQTRLMEADEAKKAKYEQAKRSSVRSGTFAAPKNPGTKITNIKQIEAPSKMPDPKSGKGSSIVNPAGDFGSYLDGLDHGVFSNNKSGNGEPGRAKFESGTKPNQTTKAKAVNHNPGKLANESSGKGNVLPAAQRADQYFDNLPRGIFSGSGGSSPEVKAPKATSLNGTTRPKATEKKANMDRDPVVKPKDNTDKTFGKTEQPSDAPKKVSYEKVKSGVAVRVNEKAKARFDVISQPVLERVVNNYKRFGYKVTLESIEPFWKKDKKLLGLLVDSVAAKHNFQPSLSRNLVSEAFKRFHDLTKKDFNSFYESREQFLGALKTVFTKLTESVDLQYRKSLKIFDTNSRIISEGKTLEIEILTEATDPQMALRQVRNKLVEEYGLNVKIKHVFVDGSKFDVKQIKEWARKSR